MGTYSYGYGYNPYGGVYNTQTGGIYATQQQQGQQSGGSLLGNTSMMSTTPHSSPPQIAHLGNQKSVSSQSSQSGDSGGSGGVSGFFKGILNGGTNMIKGMADPKNWPMMIGAAALTIACPPAGMALA